MSDYKIELGIKLDTSDLQTQVNAAGDNIKPIDIKVDAETKELTKTIKEALKGLTSGTKNALTLDTTKIESSLNEVHSTIKEIRTSLSSIDSGAGMKSLLSSINQISTALDKASAKFDELNMELKTLSAKDFSINVGINTGGSNPIARNAAYGSKVRNETLPQLKQQAEALESYLKEYYKVADGFNAAQKLIQGTNAGKGKANLYDLLPKMLDSSGSLSSQMTAWKEYIALIKEAASLKGGNVGAGINDVVSGFSQSADKLIQDAQDVQTGVNETKDALKGFFGAGIDTDGLSNALQPIAQDIKQISDFVNGLAKNNSIDSLTASFNRLAQALEPLTVNLKETQELIGKVGNSGTSVSQGSNGVKNLEQDLKQIIAVADNTEDVVATMSKALRDLGIGFSDFGVDVVTKDIQEMGIEVQNVITRINGNNLEVSISGMQRTEDGIKRVVTATKKYADAIENTENINKIFVQSFETSADAAKRLEKETTASFKKLKSLAQDMGKIDIQIASLEASGDIDGADSLRRVLNGLESDFRELYSITEKNLSVGQFRELEQIFANTTGEVREFKNELSKSAEAKELASGLERLKSITKEIAALKIDIFKFEDVDNIERASNRLNELEVEASGLRAELQQKFNITSFDEIDDIARKGEEALSRLINKAAEAKAKLASEIKFKIVSGGYNEDLSRVNERFVKLSYASKDLRSSIDEVKKSLIEMDDAAKSDDTERLIQAQKNYARALETTNNLLRMQERQEKADNDRLKLEDDIKLFSSEIDSWLAKNSAAIEKFGDKMLELKAKAESCDNVELNHLRKQFKLLDREAEKAGLKMMSFSDRIKTKLKEYSAYFSVAEVFMYVTQGLKDMFDQVVAIDTAMTELKKVTNETDSSYNQFLTNAASRAKELGITVDGLVTSAADFARLGYEFKDVQGLAEVANIYSVVGDDIDSVETATQSLISTMTAFKDEMNGLGDSDFALSIVDKMNEVSNNFAISSGGIGEALQRSASSMAAANNTMDETIALITAAM